MSRLRLSDHQVLHNIASSSNFFDFARIFSLFSLVFRTSKLLKFKEFNKTIIPFTLIRHDTGYSQLGATRLFTISYPTRAHGIIVNYYSFKIFPRFWLVKTTRIIHHKPAAVHQINDVKSAARCRLLNQWRQKCSPLQIIEPLTEKSWGRDCVIFVEQKNGCE